MLLLGFVETCPLMLGLFLTGASVAEVFFMFESVLLEVTDHVRYNDFLLLFCSARRTLLFFQLSRFDFQPRFFHVHILQIDIIDI